MQNQETVLGKRANEMIDSEQATSRLCTLSHEQRAIELLQPHCYFKNQHWYLINGLKLENLQAAQYLVPPFTVPDAVRLLNNDEVRFELTRKITQVLTQAPNLALVDEFVSWFLSTYERTFEDDDENRISIHRISADSKISHAIIHQSMKLIAAKYLNGKTNAYYRQHTKGVLINGAYVKGVYKGWKLKHREENSSQIIANACETMFIDATALAISSEGLSNVQLSTRESENDGHAHAFLSKDDELIEECFQDSFHIEYFELGASEKSMTNVANPMNLVPMYDSDDDSNVVIASDSSPIEVTAAFPTSSNTKAVNKQICQHNKRKYDCRECGGSTFCHHGKYKRACRECGGSSFCHHGKYKRACRECGGSSFCHHGKFKTSCRECGGSSFCHHGKFKNICRECGGSALCQHEKNKYFCKVCKGSALCQHEKSKYGCKVCNSSKL